MIVAGAVAALALIATIIALTPKGGDDQAGEERISPHQYCQEAIELHRNGKYDTAIERWRKAAFAGSPTAALVMGMMHDPVLFRGNFTPLPKPEEDAARKWYRGADLFGVAEAKDKLSDLDRWKADGGQLGRQASPPTDIPSSCVNALAPETKVAELKRLFDPPRLGPEELPGDPSLRRPLSVSPGSSLPRRVLTRHGVTPKMAAGENTRPVERPLRPLSPYYVYGEQVVGETKWLELGAGTKAAPNSTVWVREQELISWNQALVATFSPRGTRRDRALLYRTDEKLKELIEYDQRPREVAKLSKNYCDNKTDALQIVGGIEPFQEFDPKTNFYFMPIIGHKESVIDGKKNYLLQVTALNLLHSDPQANRDQVRCDYNIPAQPSREATPAAVSRPNPPPPVAAPSGNRKFRLGVVFVVDTTQSMGPYIEATKRALRQFHQGLQSSEDGRDMGIGLVAFRSSPSKRPQTEYAVQVFAPLQPVLGSVGFANALDRMTESTASTHLFREDSLLGVDTAINRLDWSNYDSGVVVVVTDASSMEAGRSDGLDTPSDNVPGSPYTREALRLLAEGKNLYIAVAHILSPEGRPDHQRAERQYRDLTQSSRSGRSNFYIPLLADNARSYGTQLAETLNNLPEMKRKIERNEEIAPNTPMGLLGSMADMGRPMQLRFYAQNSTEAPKEVFNAWISDRNLGRPSDRDVSIRILLTKDQLSRLHTSVSQIITARDAMGKDGRSVFKRLRDVSANTILGPERVSDETLGGLSRIDDILGGLPYRSKFLDMTAGDWSGMSYEEHANFLVNLQAKLAYYKEIHDDPGKWAKPTPDTSDSDSLTALELEQLP